MYIWKIEEKSDGHTLLLFSLCDGEELLDYEATISRYFEGYMLDVSLLQNTAKVPTKELENVITFLKEKHVTKQKD